ncbi:MAG TPA: hypothetical protein DCS97_12950 [Planctomycetes bacterium]|nr:hypothetical protein [Planctomycetota bacterium]
MPESTPLTRDMVADAVAECIAQHRRPGLRPVWRAIVAKTGQRPSFSTVSRLLAELEAAGKEPQPSAPPDQLVAQAQLLAPAMWQAALLAARQEAAAENARLVERLQASAERERELLAELDDAQARAIAAEEQRAAAESDAEAARAQCASLTAGLAAVAAAHSAAAEQWGTTERTLVARNAQLERECATLAANTHHAREATQQATNERDRAREELSEAQRRTDTYVTMNAHLREQIATRDADIVQLRRDLESSLHHERSARQVDTALRHLRRDLVMTEGRLLRRLAHVAS